MVRLHKEICAGVVLLMMPSIIASQLTGNAVTVSGMVLSEGHNERIEHVSVRLCDGGGNLIEESITGQNGEFSFRGVQRGHYILTLNADGYQSQEVQLDMSYTSDKGMTIYMVPVSKESPPPAAGPTVSAHELSMSEAARKLVASGRKKLYADKNPDASLTDFQQAVAKAPDYYEAYSEMAIAYVTMGKTQEAQGSFRKSIEASHNTYGDAYVGLGTLLIEKGSVDEGEKDLRRGVELSPKSWRGFYELGKLELGHNHLDLALKSAEQAKTLAPNVPIIYRLLANIHIQQKSYSELLNDLDTYIKLDPDSPAGLRAAQMREQVAQEVAKHSPTPSTQVEPQ
jgi:Tfp pilus assembly protein PilF